MNSPVSANDSILEFIVSTEDEESSEKQSSKISKKNSKAGTSWFEYKFCVSLNNKILSKWINNAGSF